MSSAVRTHIDVILRADKVSKRGGERAVSTKRAYRLGGDGRFSRNDMTSCGCAPRAASTTTEVRWLKRACGSIRGRACVPIAFVRNTAATDTNLLYGAGC